MFNNIAYEMWIIVLKHANLKWFKIKIFAKSRIKHVTKISCNKLSAHTHDYFLFSNFFLFMSVWLCLAKDFELSSLTYQYILDKLKQTKVFSQINCTRENRKVSYAMSKQTKIAGFFSQELYLLF